MVAIGVCFLWLQQRLRRGNDVTIVMTKAITNLDKLTLMKMIKSGLK